MMCHKCDQPAISHYCGVHDLHKTKFRVRYVLQSQLPDGTWTDGETYYDPPMWKDTLQEAQETMEWWSLSRKACRIVKYLTMFEVVPDEK